MATRYVGKGRVRVRLPAQRLVDPAPEACGAAGVQKGDDLLRDKIQAEQANGAARSSLVAGYVRASQAVQARAGGRGLDDRL